MKLVDGMKDEKLGSALLYGFTKGYGLVPMDVYDIVLPLLYNDTFRTVIQDSNNLSECINKCNQLDSDFKNNLDQVVKDMTQTTNNALGLSLLNKDLEYKVVEGVMVGKCIETSRILDLNEAIKLGQFVQGMSAEDIKKAFEEQFTIVFLDSASVGEDIDLSKISTYGNLINYPTSKVEEVVDRIKDADVIITNKHYLGKEQLENCSKVKLICVTATGYNNIDINYCNQRNITVCNVKGYSTKAVAQHTFALLLSLYNKVPYYHNYIDSKQYATGGSFTHIGETFYELDGKTYGIVGMGDIGREVAKIATAFGLNVQYYSTSGKNTQQDYPQVDFDTLLKTSDIISIHAPLNDQTTNLFNKEAFKKMKTNAYLINVGRGKIVNEDDLVEAINNEEIAGAGLDVFTNEPMSEDSPLLTINNPNKLLMTPHVAWAPVETRNRVIDEVCLNINGFKTHNLRNVCK